MNATIDRMFRREGAQRRSRIQAALFRARAHDGAKAAQPLGDGRYRVVGLRGTYFVALFDNETSRCTCTRGSFGQPCYHAACTWLRSIADQAHTAAAGGIGRSRAVESDHRGAERL